MVRITDKKLLKGLLNEGRFSDSDSEAVSAYIRKSSNKQNKNHIGNVCPIPPVMPAAILYRALVTSYGRYASGGLLVHELCFNQWKRRWRIDMAIPKYGLGIEIDGWAYHGRHLTSFARDREKSIWFERKGWRVIRFSARQINNDLAEVCKAVKEILELSHEYNPMQWSIEPAGFDRSEFVLG